MAIVFIHKLKYNEMEKTLIQKINKNDEINNGN